MDPQAVEVWESSRPGSSEPVHAACHAPWVSIEFDPQGWVYTCCANQQYPLGRIGDDRLRDLWAGPRAQVLRDALRRWDMSVGCGSCRWHIEHGNLANDAAVYDRYRLDSPDPSGPASMTFALSNRCNLACAMCNGELSSTIRRGLGQPPLPDRYDDQFFDDLAEFLPTLQYAKFLGGEPFLVPAHDRVWRLMDEFGGPPRMQVTTNGTVWTDRVEWLLDRFDVDVTLSIDAVSAETYERIRVGASHQMVMRNVERFRERCARAGTELRLCFCLMEHNWSELPSYLAWADELGAPVSVNVVSDPGHALHDLPAHELDRVSRAWQQAPQADGLQQNAGVWETQVAQLQAVLDERRRGVPPAVRHAQRAVGNLVEDDANRGCGTDSDVEAEIGRLTAWSGGGAVARIEVGPDGVVLAVDRSHERLGIDRTLVGRMVSSLAETLTEADGREPWVLDRISGAGVEIRTFVLSATRPERGGAGSIVRTVTIPSGTGRTVLLAEDRIYDRSVPVSLTKGRPSTRPGPMTPRSA